MLGLVPNPFTTSLHKTPIVLFLQFNPTQLLSSSTFFFVQLQSVAQFSAAHFPKQKKCPLEFCSISSLPKPSPLMKRHKISFHSSPLYKNYNNNQNFNLLKTKFTITKKIFDNKKKNKKIKRGFLNLVPSSKKQSVPLLKHGFVRATTAPSHVAPSYSSGWNSLPSELLVSIFVRLGAVELAFGAPETCRSWRRASGDPAVWSTIDLRGWADIRQRLIRAGVVDLKSVSLGTLLVFVAQRGGEAVEKIWFSDYPVYGGDFIYVANRCPNIKFFYLRFSTLISKDVFCLALERWRNLEGMDVDDTCLHKEVLQKIGVTCKNFTHLRVYSKLRLTAAHDIACLLPNIKSLDLSDTLYLCKALIAILKECKGLESLDITGSKEIGFDPEVEKLAANLKVFFRDSKPFMEEQQELLCLDCVNDDYYELGVVYCSCGYGI